MLVRLWKDPVPVQKINIIIFWKFSFISRKASQVCRKKNFPVYWSNKNNVRTILCLKSGRRISSYHVIFPRPHFRPAKPEVLAFGHYGGNFLPLDHSWCKTVRLFAGSCRLMKMKCNRFTCLSKICLTP